MTTVLLVMSGSRMYGTARTDASGNIVSDKDLRGVIIPPWQYILGRVAARKGERLVMDQTNIPGEADGLLYSLQFFVQQLIGSNPQHLEILFAPPENTLICDEIGKSILSMRDAFVCKRFYKRIFGFSNTEWRKARGVEVEKNNAIKTEQAIINDIDNVFGNYWGEMRYDKMETVRKILYSSHERKEVPSTDKLSGKRKAEFEQYGYGASSACHAIRLARQCKELLNTGTMTFPRPDAAELLKIKTGKIKFEAVQELYAQSILEAEDAVAHSDLPDFPDIPRIIDWFERIVAHAVFKDTGFRTLVED
jgi:predicted nucleotidyltransferase